MVDVKDNTPLSRHKSYFPSLFNWYSIIIINYFIFVLAI